MTKQFWSYSAAICLAGGIFTALGCSTPQSADHRTVAQATQTQMTPAEISAEQKMEENFQNIFNSENPSKAATDQLEKLFTLRVKSNLFIDKFSDALDLAVKNKSQNPDFEILQTPEYRALLKAWNLNERYTHEIAYMYDRTLDTRTDLSLPDNTRKKARQLFKDVNKYLMNSKDLQKAEFQPLMLELKDIYSDHVHKFIEELKAQNKTKDIAAVSRVPEFENSIIKDTKVMNALAKSTSTKSKSQAALSKSRMNNEVDADLAAIADPIAGREPQSDNIDLTCKEGKKLCISTGESGNIIGAVFPKGVWAFTYDDGPAAKSTDDIMNLFIAHRDAINPVGKATFFWTAKNVLLNGSKVIQKALDNNFPIENHSYSHANLAVASTEERIKQVKTSNSVIEAEVSKYSPGYKIQYFRCPYGACYAPKIPAIRQMLVDQKQMHAYWRIDSLDWKLLNSEKIADLVIKQIQLQGQGVILMHDVHPTTVGATKIVLNWIKDQNNNKGKSYKMVTLNEAVELVNGKK